MGQMHTSDAGIKQSEAIIQLLQEMDNHFMTQQTILGTEFIDNSINLDSQHLSCRYNAR